MRFRPTPPVWGHSTRGPHLYLAVVVFDPLCRICACVGQRRFTAGRRHGTSVRYGKSATDKELRDQETEA